MPGFSGFKALSKFGDGQSNPTYKIEAVSGNYVLRAKPPGELLKSAHAVDREYRVMDALARYRCSGAQDAGHHRRWRR